MKVSIFVTCSALALAAWLGLTYLHVVPNDEYPRLGRSSLPISAKRDAAPGEPAKPLVRLAEEPEAGAVATIEE